MRVWKRPPRPHGAGCKRTAIFFTYCFDLGSDLDTSKFVDTLLKAGIAETAVLGSREGIRLGHRYRGLRKISEEALRLHAIGQYIDGTRTRSELTIRQKVRLIRITLHGWISQWRSRSTSTSGGNGEGSIVDLSGVARDIGESVRKRQLLAGLQQAVDRELYIPGYLATDPYFRVELRGARLEFEDVATGLNRFPQYTEITLLVHRSGVALLTIPLFLDQELTLEQVGRITRSDYLHVPSLSVAESVAVSYAKTYGAPPSALRGSWSDVSEGESWLTMKSEDESRIVDVFEVYKDALSLFASPSATPGWMCYSTVMVDELTCLCDSREEWLKSHQKELWSVLARTPDKTTFRGDALSDKVRDHSIYATHSLFLLGGLALDLNWRTDERAESNSVDWLNRLTVIEHALIQYWQLRVMDSLLSSETDFENSAAALQERLIFGLQEYGTPRLSYGSANDIANVIVAGLNGDVIYSRVMDRTELLRELLVSRHATRSALRMTRIAVAGLLAAVMFGLPSIREGIRVVDAAVVQDLTVNGWGDRLAVVIYTIFVVLIILTLLVRSPRYLRGIRRRKFLTVGVEWPEGLRRVVIEHNRSNGTALDNGRNGGLTGRS